MALPPEVEASYVVIIDSILAASDLNTITSRRIRDGLQQAVEYDITPQKDAIKYLIMTRFNKFVADKNTIPTTNGNNHIKPKKPDSPEPVVSTPPPKKQEDLKQSSDDDDDLSDVPDTPPPKKKRKTVPLDSDAAFAAKLQAEENIRARPTRGGANRKTPAVKKKRTPKKKTANKVKAEDDSDIDGSGSEVGEKKPNRSGGFHKPLTLSAPLSALLDNEVQLSRPQTVKKIWEYIRKWDLQDPADKRQIRCDEPMRAVFKQDKVHMFTMNKILSRNLR